jgi:hypothetical protein
MDRRTFLGTGTAFGLMAPGAALAAGKCVSVAYGGVCTSALRFDAIARNFDYENQDRWGWSTAISMIFAFYGYRVGPQKIVDKAYDGNFSLGGDFVENARQLNRPWIDDDGKAFLSEIKPLFAVAPNAQLTAQAAMVSALDHGQPVLLCDARHAMVLTSLSYANAPSAPIIQRAVVADPWPDNEHIHVLEPVDLTAPPVGRLRLAAIVQVYATGTEVTR